MVQTWSHAGAITSARAHNMQMHVNMPHSSIHVSVHMCAKSELQASNWTSHSRFCTIFLLTEAHTRLHALYSHGNLASSRTKCALPSISQLVSQGFVISDDGRHSVQYQMCMSGYLKYKHTVNTKATKVAAARHEHH